MHRRGEPQPAGAGSDRDSEAVTERHTVSELVRSYDDGHGDGQKRDRSESGDSAPAGKRGARERSGEPVRSPAVARDRSFKESLDSAFDELERRVTQSLLRDLHEFRASLSSEIEKLNDRVKDLERHVEEKDGTIDQLTDELHQSREEVAALQLRVEEAEIHSRQPCLILSGAAMAPRNRSRPGPPLPARSAPGAEVRSHARVPVPGQGQAGVTSHTAGPPSAGRERGPEEAPPDSAEAGSSRLGARGRSAAGGGGWEEREDVNALVVGTLNRCMPGLNLVDADIASAHRLPGPNNRVIVRFVRWGPDSARDQVWTRRLELRGKELFVGESLTKTRSLIFRSLLAAKREKRLYTVYTRGGNVYFKEQQFGVSTRVDSLKKVRDSGFTVLER